MARIPLAALGLFAFAAPALSAPCEDVLGGGSSCGGAAALAQSESRKTGALWKAEVDGLIGLMIDTARQQGTVLGGGDVATLGKALVAMAHSHRRYYHPNDVPAVSRGIDFLIQQRRQDSSFGDNAATSWAAAALAAVPLEPQHFATEVEAARTWLAKRQVPADGFEERVRALQGALRDDVFPQHLGKDVAKQAAAWVADKKLPDAAAAAEALLQLVVGQVVNKKLDRAQDPAVAAATWTPAQQKAVDWLLTQQKDGVFSVAMGGKSFPDPALTGFGIWALQTKPKGKRAAAEQAVIDAGARWLLGKQNEDGTFGERVPNYTTCVVVGALSRWGDPAIAPVLAKAQKAILMFQNSEANGYQSGDRDYGSIGYGNAQRGDLSNLHFSLEALRQTGLPENHEALQKALVFLQRTQNLKATNDFKGKVPDPDREGVILDATPGNDGGASYYPGNSAAGYDVLPDGKASPRSYGSMTYALLKSYTLAGIRGDDPRVKAAVQWIESNWTLAVNPGADPAMGEKVKYQGLFYYYMVLAQALDLAKVAAVNVPATDASGKATTTPVDWRKALRSHLEGMQQADGTWVNGKNDRWMEGLPLLCTCYALAALERCP